jgi:hypothetical protein
MGGLLCWPEALSPLSDRQGARYQVSRREARHLHHRLPQCPTNRCHYGPARLPQRGRGRRSRCERFLATPSVCAGRTAPNRLTIRPREAKRGIVERRRTRNTFCWLHSLSPPVGPVVRKNRCVPFFGSIREGPTRQQVRHPAENGPVLAATAEHLVHCRPPPRATVEASVSCSVVDRDRGTDEDTTRMHWDLVRRQGQCRRRSVESRSQRW